MRSHDNKYVTFCHAIVTLKLGSCSHDPQYSVSCIVKIESGVARRSRNVFLAIRIRDIEKESKR